MTLNEFLDWMDVVRPSPWSHEQKAVWVNDLESSLWSQILLAPAGSWRMKTAAEDGEKPLLLPDGWRKLYAAYVTAMMDYAAGEAGAYANAMALYNGHLAELGAWYADGFAPAGQGPVWMKLADVSASALGEEPVYLGDLPAGAAVLAAEIRIKEAFDGEGHLVLHNQAEESYVSADPSQTGLTVCRAMALPGEERGVYVSHTAGDCATGTAALRLLIQPAVHTEPAAYQAYAAYTAQSGGTAGAPGKDGVNGKDGKDGADGASAYEIALANGFKGTEIQWLESLKGEPGEDGKDGAPGADGKNGADGADGAPGADGKNGADGVGIASMKQTTASSADGGSNVFTVTLTDGSTAAFTVKNGSKGSNGAAGTNGKDGADGATAAQVIAALPTETWTFTLSDGTTVEKVVPLV